MDIRNLPCGFAAFFFFGILYFLSRAAKGKRFDDNIDKTRSAPRLSLF
jgi:hypothetical protein